MKNQCYCGNASQLNKSKPGVFFASLAQSVHVECGVVSMKVLMPSKIQCVSLNSFFPPTHTKTIEDGGTFFEPSVRTWVLLGTTLSVLGFQFLLQKLSGLRPVLQLFCYFYSPLETKEDEGHFLWGPTELFFLKPGGLLGRAKQPPRIQIPYQY